MSKKAIPEVDNFGRLKFLPAFVLGPVVSAALGGAAAWYLYSTGNTELFDRNIARLAETEQGYTHLAAALFSFIVDWINTYPMFYKTMVMRFTSGNLRANMQIYKRAGKDANEDGYVVLETSGPVGSYNRANRSLTHFVENSIPMALFIPLCGAVFPFPTFLLTALFGFGRIMHQIGYASIGYGGHGIGFAIASLAKATMQMLCVLAADKSMQLGWAAQAVTALNDTALAPYIPFPSLGAVKVEL